MLKSCCRCCDEHGFAAKEKLFHLLPAAAKQRSGLRWFMTEDVGQFDGLEVTNPSVLSTQASAAGTR